MRIRLTKISNERHRLEIVRADGSRDQVELVTRESFFHDLLHYSVESTLPTDRGFWGTLAGGKSFADVNDRSGESTKENAEMLYKVEGIVGVMTTVVPLPVEQALSKLRWFSETQSQEIPDWCNEHFVGTVCERMRQLIGEWKATAFGETMEIAWEPAQADQQP